MNFTKKDINDFTDLLERIKVHYVVNNNIIEIDSYKGNISIEFKPECIKTTETFPFSSMPFRDGEDKTFNNTNDLEKYIRKFYNRENIKEDNAGEYTNLFFDILFDYKNFKYNHNLKLNNNKRIDEIGDEKICLTILTTQELDQSSINQLSIDKLNIEKLIIERDSLTTPKDLMFDKVKYVEFVSSKMPNKDTFCLIPNVEEIKLADTTEYFINTSFYACIHLKKINIPEKTIFSTKMFSLINELEEINYKDINILDYYSLENFKNNSDAITLKFIYLAAKDERLDDCEKLMILNGKLSNAEIFKYFLENKKDILKDIFDQDFLYKIINDISDYQDIINSDEFYELIKYKDLKAHTNISYITNAKVLLKLFEFDVIIDNIDKLDDKFKHNKDFITSLFNKRKDEMGRLCTFKNTLSYFKDDETIVGQFAKILKISEINSFYGLRIIKKPLNDVINSFLDIVDWDIKDLDKMRWLIANNINFIDIFNNDNFNETILQLISSFDTVTEEQPFLSQYKLTSPYHEITIWMDDSTIHLNIHNTDSSNFLTFSFDKDNEIYEEMKQIFNEEIKDHEIDKEV